MTLSKDVLAELRRRAMEVTGLGAPAPRVSVEVAELVVDLLLALQDALDELQGHRGR